MVFYCDMVSREVLLCGMFYCETMSCVVFYCDMVSCGEFYCETVSCGIGCVLGCYNVFLCNVVCATRSVEEDVTESG